MSQDVCERWPPRHICTLIAVEPPSTAVVQQWSSFHHLGLVRSHTTVHTLHPVWVHLWAGWRVATVAVLKAPWEALFLPRGSFGGPTGAEQGAANSLCSSAQQ